MVSCSIFIITSLFPYFAYSNSIHEKHWISAPKQKIDNINKKIEKIARDVQYASSDKRDYLLSNIEKKLQKAAQHFGPKGKKHVELIMQGIKLKAFGTLKDTTMINSEANLNLSNSESFLSEDQLIKTKIADNLSNKIDSLIKNELERLQTPQNKHQLLENIKERVLESVSEKQKEILEIDKDLRVDLNHTRRIDFKINDEAEVKNPNNSANSIFNLIQDDVDIDAKHVNEIPNINTVTDSPVCENVFDRTCLEIKNMNSLKCLYDDVTVPLDKLCNENIDCPDRSDEKYCGSQECPLCLTLKVNMNDVIFKLLNTKVQIITHTQTYKHSKHSHISDRSRLKKELGNEAMERMQYSNWVMTNIETYLGNNCFEMEESSSMSAKRNQIIQDVLQAHTDFKGKYKNFTSSFHTNNLSRKGEFDNEASIKVNANEIAIILSSLALALEGAICSHRSVDFQTRRQTDILDKDIEQKLKESSWPPKLCKCNREYCSNCTNACKRICWHKNSLTQWNCESIDGTDIVPLDSLCDGKLDCFDESDEKGCTTGSGIEKFEAHEMYSNILKMLNLKASKERSSTQKILLNLRNSIVKLQKLTMKTIANPTAIKKLRSKCYSLLRVLYSDILRQSFAANESEEAYFFLLAINEKLGAALKRSHTGNVRIIADSCYCRNGTCGKTFCSKVCIKACAVESKLMSYHCNKGSNVTVSIDEICNGKPNCPNGFDELNCNKEEICRRHHLILLRHNLQDVGSNLKGTALGELLMSWKIKVISTIKVAENGRPKPKVLKNIVKDILRDLLVTYGSVEDYRKSNGNYALPEFLNIARIIMDTLKSCGK